VSVSFGQKECFILSLLLIEAFYVRRAFNSIINEISFIYKVNEFFTQTASIKMFLCAIVLNYLQNFYEKSFFGGFKIFK
jgi:hypothetical protein